MNTSIPALLFVIFLSSVTEGNCQKAFPEFKDNPVWRVMNCHWLDCFTDTYVYDYDTTFCGHDYSRIYFPFERETGYFRSDDIKTFFRRSTNCADKEYLIYDYSLKVGEYAFVAYDFPLWDAADTTLFMVAEIDTINYFGIDRVRFRMLFDPWGQNFEFTDEMYWIKGVGSETHPFYPFKCLFVGCENRFATLCYDSSGVLLYQNKFTEDCSPTLVKNSEFESEVSIYPNPFKEEIAVSIQDGMIIKINIYSIVGHKVVEYEVENQRIVHISTSGLNLGTYLVELQTSHGIFTKIMLKIH
jgi:hypothetical protein